MEYREMLYNWATQKKPPEALEDTKKFRSTIGERKEDFLRRKLEFAASFGMFSIALRTPFKLRKKGESDEELTQEELKKFAQDYGLDFDPNHNMTGTEAGKGWTSLSFDKKQEE